MLSKTKKKTGKKQKRFPYIEVEGVESCYLDAALLTICTKEALIHSLSDELKLLKKADITVQELKRKELSHSEIIKRVSPHLLESYFFYNFLANFCEDLLEPMINHYFDGISNQTVEDWFSSIKELINTKEISIFDAVNALRLYKNGERKVLIKSLLEEKKYIIAFYQETGIQIEQPGIVIDWNEINDAQHKNMIDHEDELEANQLLEDDVFNKDPEEALKIAAKIILRVSEQVSHLEKVEEYKTLYQSEKEQVAIGTAKVEELTHDLKLRDSQIQTISKENRTLTKSVDSLNEKLKQQQKEVGKLGSELGEIRKEKAELEKEKTSLERRVNTLEKESTSISDKVRAELKRDFDKRIFKLKDDYEAKTLLLEKKLDDLKVMYEGEQDKNKELFESLENLEHDQKNNIYVIEKEDNKLEKQTSQDHSTAEDDVLFGFNEVEIENFVEFDNKPTRN